MRPLAEQKAEALFYDVRMEEECRPRMRSKVMKKAASRSAAPRSAAAFWQVFVARKVAAVAESTVRQDTATFHASALSRTVASGR